MAVQSLVIACSSTPQVVAGNGLHGTIEVRLKSLAGTCYLGSSSVTTGGYPMTTADAGVFQVPLWVGNSLWVASSSGATASLAVLRLNDTT